MRFVLFASFLVACGPPSAPKQPTPETPPRSAAGSATGKPVASMGSGSGGVAATVPLKDIGCPAPTCVYHVGGAAYFTCLAGGAGLCFHFGGPCAPPDHCMYDAADRTYKQCAKPVEGACTQFGAACAPVTKCMFDPADGLHHRCDAPSGGTCASYGALCAP